MGLGHRGDLGDRERKILSRQRGDDEQPLLADRNIADLAFVDIEDDPVAVERRNLKDLLAALQRRTDRLGQVATDDQAVERSGQFCARQLFIDETDLRIGLVALSGGYLLLGTVSLSDRPFAFDLAAPALAC